MTRSATSSLARKEPACQSRQSPSVAARLGLLIGEDEGDRRAAAARSAGAAGAVNVPLVLVRRVEIDHVRDVVEVEAAGGDIGGDERRDLAGLEAGQCP